MQTAAQTSRATKTTRKAVGEGGDDQERDGKSGGVDRKQCHALSDCGTGRARCQDRAKDRTDARCPAKAKGQPKHVSPWGAPRQVEMKAQIAFHRLDAGGPQHEEPEQYDDSTAEDVELIGPAQQGLSKRRGRGPEDHENRGKTQHKPKAEPDNLPPTRIYPSSNHHDPETDDLGQTVLNHARIAQVFETGCQQTGQPISPLDLAQERQPSIGTHIRTVKSKQDRLAFTGDNAG